MAAVFGFNVGAVISLGDMEKTIEFISENSDEITDNKSVDNIDEKFMLKSLPQPITVNSIIEKNEIDEEEFELDDSDFDNILGDEYSEDEYEDTKDVKINKTDLLIKLQKEKEDRDKQAEYNERQSELIKQKDLIEDSEERLRKAKEVESNILKQEQDNHEIEELKRQLEKERRAREKAEELAKEKQKANLLSEINAEKDKSAKLAEKLREEKLAQLRENKRKEIIEKKKKEMLNEKIKQASLEKDKNNVNLYDTMEIEALYSEVRKFMSSLGVNRSIVDTKTLEDKFGKQNIKKLILKSYLISIGKGVTVGR